MKNTSKNRLSIERLVSCCCSFFFILAMLQKLRSIIACFFSSRNLNYFWSLKAFAKVFFSLAKTRSRSFLRCFYFVVEKDRSQSRLRRTHSMQLLDLSSTLQFLDKRKQLWQGRMITRFEPRNFRYFSRRRVELLVLQDRWHDM